MSDDVDIRRVLNGWPYDPNNDVRLSKCEDGRSVLQVRLPAGIEQYEVTGRPDGRRPYGKESVLEHHLARFSEARARGKAEAFKLSQEECAELFDEGTLYYFRYARLLQVGHWEYAIRDTARNLRLFDFVHRHAEREEERDYLEQWRPYLLRMNATARAMQQLEQSNHGTALEIVREAVRQIRELPDMDEETFQLERQRSIETLAQLETQLEQHRPLSKVERLERELQKAVRAEAFERAARLRDQIRSLKNQGSR